MAIMKSKLVIFISIICLIGVVLFVGYKYSRSGDWEANVRHDASWFTSALAARNEKVFINYLASPKVSHEDLSIEGSFETGYRH